MLYASGLRLHNWLRQGRRRVLNLGDALHEGLLCFLLLPASATSQKVCDISSLPRGPLWMASTVWVLYFLLSASSATGGQGRKGKNAWASRVASARELLRLLVRISFGSGTCWIKTGTGWWRVRDGSVFTGQGPWWDSIKEHLKKTGSWASLASLPRGCLGPGASVPGMQDACAIPVEVLMWMFAHSQMRSHTPKFCGNVCADELRKALFGQIV